MKPKPKPCAATAKTWSNIPKRDQRDVLDLLSGYVKAADSLANIEHLQPGVARMAVAYAAAIKALRAAAKERL